MEDFPSFDDGTDEFVASREFSRIKAQAYEHLLGRVDQMGPEFARLPAPALKELVRREFAQFAQQRNLPLNQRESALLVEAVAKELTGFGPLDDLLSDPSVEDILINGAETVYVCRGGKLQRSSIRFTDDAHLLRIVRRILAPAGRRLDESSPMVDARLPDGGRINAIIEPLALDGPTVSIRKFRDDPLTPDDLVSLGTFDEPVAALLAEAVRARCNFLVSGGTSSGKTSLLNALATYIDENQRIVTIEDTAELALAHPHVVRLEARPGSFDGTGAATIRDLLRNSLRMRPDRIIVGEVRGAEVLEMLQAMNTGHDGSMGTIHASSPRECLYRLEMLAGFAGYQGSEVSLRRQIANALDFIIQIGRLSDGRRRVLSVTEVTGMHDNVIATQELFRYQDGEPRDGEWIATGVRPHTEKMRKLAGSAERTAAMFNDMLES
jgi:pilus assembly protein CpaF